jgi:Zn-dependent protease with chaperone function
MAKRGYQPDYYFWLLVTAALILTGLGLMAMTWDYSLWGHALWSACYGLYNLKEHAPVIWQMLVLSLIFTIVIRGGWRLGHQIRATQRFVRLFLPLRHPPSPRVSGLLKAQNIRRGEVIFLNLSSPHIFCLGFWRPQIWLTAGLVDLLTDEELAAVLAHEAYHCHRRDPLRLLISRTLRAAFFFLPLVGDLAKGAELQQEIAADQSAINQLGNDLPLLCALQKLLNRGILPAFPHVTLSPFNVTEARLQRLIYPEPPPLFNWKMALSALVINLGVVLMLLGMGFLSAQPTIKHQTIASCAIGRTTLPTTAAFGQFQLPER